MTTVPPAQDGRIAIVGMACRVPGANDLETFWGNLVHGVESIETIPDAELRAAGVPEAWLADSRYVRRGGFIAGIDRFDAPLFNCTPREAAMLDPQHRVLMECAWHALEHAGHGGIDRRLRAGVFVGVANSAYYHRHVVPSLDARDSSSAYQALISGERDFLATRLAYYFDLLGPAVNVQTACSTSLVAVHLACQSLLNGECDLAIAGGAAVRLPQRVGYLHEEGMILSKDGHCRAFDAEASGTVIGNGAGIVILRRLEDALADGDTVHAVVLGSAVNNDGSQKVGYTAPSIEGQAAVVLEAQTVAGIAADTVGYVEAHGTGTALGDPIEVAALTEVFRRATPARGICALGSVKSNIGHLDIAAGVVGLIKAALVVSRGIIPPSLHFRRANPALSLEASPFVVPAAARAWASGEPRRAGVSAFGIGGTNAHVVLEEPEPRDETRSSRAWNVLCLSAHAEPSARSLERDLAAALQSPGVPSLDDVAFTLAAGRRHLRQRRAVVCRTAEEAAAALRSPGPLVEAADDRRVVLLFGDGDGATAGLGQALAAQEAVFDGAASDAASTIAAFQHAGTRDAAVFSFQYALAELLKSWGVRPQAVLGAGLGEVAAAMSAGILSMTDAARLVAAWRDETRFREELSRVTLRAPAIPLASPATGRWVQGPAATTRDHWELVRAGGARPEEALRVLLETSGRAIVSVGPGEALAREAKRIAGDGEIVVSACGADGDERKDLAALLATLWQSGVTIDWSGVFRDEDRRRVALPSYRFNRARHWIDEPAARAVSTGSAPDAGCDARVFRQIWTREPRIRATHAASGKWLVCGDLAAMAASLEAALAGRGAAVTRCRDWSPGLMSAVAPDALVLLDARYEAVLQVVQYAARAGLDSPRIVAVTSFGQPVLGDEPLSPAAAAVAGLVRVVRQEHPETSCRAIDVADLTPADASVLADACLAPGAPALVALRHGHTWTPAVVAADVAPVPDVQSAGRVFVITGGAGHVGLSIARCLHDEERARLVLVGRTPAGSHAHDDDLVAFEIGDEPAELPAPAGPPAVEELRRAGADVLYVAADVSRPEDVRRVFAEAKARFGRVDVVVHAAGARADDAFTPIAETDEAVSLRQLAPKLHGLEALCEALPASGARTCVVMSSLAAAFGGLGFGAYAAANASLDAIAHAQDGRHGIRWLSIGWDAWLPPNPEAAARIAGALVGQALPRAEAAAVFVALLRSSAGPHVLVSRTALDRRARELWAAPPATARATALPSTPTHASTADVIAATWAELLGVEQVAADDDFYELGGNSLMATQVVSRLRRAFGIELSVRVLFESATVAELAGRVDALIEAKAGQGTGARG